MPNADLNQPPYRSTDPVVKTKELFCGTLLSTDLKKTRRFYEEVLKLECVELGSDRMLARAPVQSDVESVQFVSNYFTKSFVLDVRLSDTIDNPQRVYHHWGLELESKAAVDQIHKYLIANKEELELQQVQDTRFQHSAYSFYFSDRDSNWWEFQFLPSSKLNQVFQGDAV